jgi:hypothetical protein
MLGAGSIGKALNIASCDNAHASFDARSLIKKAGKRLAAVAFRGDHAISGVVLPVDARPRTQPVQGGFVAAIDTEPVVADGRTCLKLPFCHWKMKAAAAPFSPSASNFTGPCTLVSGTPLCR